MTRGEPSERRARSTRHLLHPQECLRGRTVRVGAHLSDLDVGLVDGLRVRVDDVLHVDDVAFFDVLEFLQNRATRVTAMQQTSHMKSTRLEKQNIS